MRASKQRPLGREVGDSMIAGSAIEAAAEEREPSAGLVV
jgi:hypothetical protein